MKIKIQVVCLKKFKDLSFDCEENKMYNLEYNVDNNSLFDYQVNKHLVSRLERGYLKLISPWRYLPSHKELHIDVYEKIKPLTDYCNRFYE